MTPEPCHPMEPVFRTHAMAPRPVPVPRHIALIGFMGAGKSSVGQRVAAQLGREFWDLDESIERDAQKPIAQIFRERGETAFRAHERAVLRTLLEREDPMVLATGGGTYVDPAMRQMVKDASCAIIHLEVDAPSVLARLAQDGGLGQRPLLDGPDPDTAVHRLLEARAKAYADGSVPVDTTSRSIDAVCDEVVAALMAGPAQEPSSGPATPLDESAPKQPRGPIASDAVRLDTPFVVAAPTSGDLPQTQVHMRLRAGPWLGETICAACPDARIVMIVTDRHVAAVHLSPLQQSLAAQGRQVETCVIAPGEATKSLAGAEALYAALGAAGLGRNDVVVALGGGVIGDLAGFVASTYLRGLTFVQVPTTTLAAIDSSIGAKTALNTASGKNQIGSFYAPRLVLIAISHLITQSRRQNAAGLVEAIKMGATHDASLVAVISRRAPELLAMGQEALADVIGRAIAIKASVVAADMRDAGSRATLNFGHTLGHAIEIGEDYKLLHGEAVALGMMGELAWAEAEGLSRGITAPLKAVLLAMNMPVEWRSANLQIEALQCDKKRVGDTIVLPIVSELGRARLHRASLDKLVAFVTDGLEP